MVGPPAIAHRPSFRLHAWRSANRMPWAAGRASRLSEHGARTRGEHATHDLPAAPVTSALARTGACASGRARELALAAAEQQADRDPDDRENDGADDDGRELAPVHDVAGDPYQQEIEV